MYNIFITLTHLSYYVCEGLYLTLLPFVELPLLLT